MIVNVSLFFLFFSWNLYKFLSSFPCGLRNISMGLCGIFLKKLDMFSIVSDDFQLVLSLFPPFLNQGLLIMDKNDFAVPVMIRYGFFNVIRSFNHADLFFCLACWFGSGAWTNWCKPGCKYKFKKKYLFFLKYSLNHQF